MRRLIIAEKHSVGQAIAQAIGGGRNDDGCIRCGDDTVTWAQGHLVDLLTPNEYQDRGWDKWDLKALPLDPTGDWRWKVNRQRDADKQYRIVKRLLDEKPDELVNACDPDREGEAIFRRIIAYAGAAAPMKRLWVASLEEDAIREALADMKDESEYQGLADAADIRSKADWLIGMNASRAWTLVYNTRMSVGRVQTPTLAMIVDRDREIEGHVARPFWKVVAPMGGWRMTSDAIEERAAAEELLNTVNADGFTFRIEVKRRREHNAPPHLYDLTGLQKDMSRMHGLTAARTLAALQSLYEKKLATYPRTDSQYITHDDLDTLRALATDERADGFIDPTARPAEPRCELTVDDGKVAGHTAILPTANADAGKLKGLTDDERLVLVRVVRRMWEAIGGDYVHDVTDVTSTEPRTGARFSCRADLPADLGWKAVEPAAARNKDDGEGEEGNTNEIPDDLETGATLPPDPSGSATLAEGRTRPPKPFTEATLLAAMEHASRFVDDKSLKAALDDDESHSGGIGTPATRADVIEKLVHVGYVQRKGRQLRSTELGRGLVDVVSPRLRNVELTADMERRLSDVEHGNARGADVYEEFRSYALRLPGEAERDVRSDLVHAREPRKREPVGKCPRCGADVVRTGTFWQCSTNRREKQPDGTWKTTAGCGFRIFPRLAGKTLTDSQVGRILAGRKVAAKGFTSKAGRKFDATMVLDKERGVRFDFPAGKK